MLVACCDQKLGNLDVALLEDHLALLVADDGDAELPLDLVERIDPFMAEEPDKVQTGRGCGCRWACGASLPWWSPPAEQRLSAYYPSENAEPADQPHGRLTPKTYKLSLEARTRLVGPTAARLKTRLGRPDDGPVLDPSLTLTYSVVPAVRGLGSPAISWPRRCAMIHSREGGDDNGPCLRRCQGPIYHILCSFLAPGARYGQLGRKARASSE